MAAGAAVGLGATGSGVKFSRLSRAEGVASGSGLSVKSSSDVAGWGAGVRWTGGSIAGEGVAEGVLVAVGDGVGVGVGEDWIGTRVGCGAGVSVGMARGAIGTGPLSSTGPATSGEGVGVGLGCSVKSCTLCCAASGEAISAMADTEVMKDKCLDM
ncbi:MAG: hypothetical protein EP341_05315 [Sphingomonadales bacterium]|nr:MAG: hypothetical protein EP341_05315 [Sphingomonadales bacterium]